MNRRNTEEYEFTWMEEIENEKGEWVKIERMATIEYTFTIESPEYENGYAYYSGGVTVDVWGTEGDEMDEYTEEKCLEEIEEFLADEYGICA